MNEGFFNEKEIINYLNMKSVKDLNVHWQSIILTMFDNNVDLDDSILCKKLYANEKADISIEINKTIKFISIKFGDSISVHQEEVISFMLFLRSIGIENKYLKILLFYHYGDGTLNGTGKIRYDSEHLKLRMERLIFILNKRLNEKQILMEVLYRFLIKGPSSLHEVNYIYYGNIDVGYVISAQKINDYLICHSSSYLKTPHFSSLIYQPWGRDLNFKNSNKRKYIQIKWKSLLADISKIINKDK